MSPAEDERNTSIKRVKKMRSIFFFWEAVSKKLMIHYRLIEADIPKISRLQETRDFSDRLQFSFLIWQCECRRFWSQIQRNQNIPRLQRAVLHVFSRGHFR